MARVPAMDRWWTSVTIAALLVACVAGAGCRRGAAFVEEARAYPAAGDQDRGSLCADVGEARACWGDGLTGGGCAGGICALARPVPAEPSAPDGWRCGGMGAARVCEARSRNAGAFRCDDGDCVQPRPRMPDDGEWECVEMDGVALCRRLSDAAGMAAGPADLGWICGARRGGRPGERVCVDLSPDRPGPDPDWVCTFEYAYGAMKRRCRRSPAERIGSACSEARRCPAGGECVSGHCLPPRPAPACWFDADCSAGARCRWATCVEGAP